MSSPPNDRLALVLTYEEWAWVNTLVTLGLQSSGKITMPASVIGALMHQIVLGDRAKVSDSAFVKLKSHWEKLGLASGMCVFDEYGRCQVHGHKTRDEHESDEGA